MPTSIAPVSKKRARQLNENRSRSVSREGQASGSIQPEVQRKSAKRDNENQWQLFSLQLRDLRKKSFWDVLKSITCGDICRQLGKAVVSFKDLIAAVVVRIMFFVIALVCIYAASSSADNQDTFYYLLIPVGALLIEGLYTTITRCGNEYRWFCPCVMFYLMSTVPSLWMLMEAGEKPPTISLGENITANTSVLQNQKEADYWVDLFKNKLGKITHEIPSNSSDAILYSKLLTYMPGSSNELPYSQLLLLILIIGRWILPRGTITRDQLSQLLIAYLGMAADILDLIGMLSDDDFKEQKAARRITLILWTISLTQFCLVKTNVGMPKDRMGFASKIGEGWEVDIDPIDREEEVLLAVCGNRITTESELFGLVTTMLMQDAPFLIFRLFIIFSYGVINASIIFFLGKNTLLFCLELYRVIIILQGPRGGGDPDERKSKLTNNVSVNRLVGKASTVGQVVMAVNEIKAPSRHIRLSKEMDGEEVTRMLAQQEEDNLSNSSPQKSSQSNIGYSNQLPGAANDADPKRAGGEQIVTVDVALQGEEEARNSIDNLEKKPLYSKNNVFR